MANWNPWHGCRKLSEGCRNCYVYRTDAQYGRDASDVRKTGDFDLPVRRNRQGEYKIPPGERVWTCFTSDFLLEDADPWRLDAWDLIRARPDLRFLFITKRIDRFDICKPLGWDDGWDNVEVCCTCENQDRADYRLPVFLSAPVKHKYIICEPLLSHIDLRDYLSDEIVQVTAGGESGPEARPCRYEWILDLREQCMEAGVPFYFKQTGAKFIKDGKLYRIERKFQHIQAKKANIDYYPVWTTGER